MQLQAAFDFTLVRRTDPETSKRAARQALAEHGPQTKDELAGHTGLDSVAVARRMAQLRDDLLVRDSGKTRPTATGRAATVWELREGVAERVKAGA